MSTFAPWVAQRRSGYLLMAGGLIVGVLTCWSYLVGKSLWWLSGLITLAFLYAGKIQLRKARSRAFGQSFEAKVTPRAVALLQNMGYSVKTGQRFQYGDIDLVVTNGNTVVTVEVKSFIQWHQFFFFKGDRERKALTQVQRQRIAMHAVRAILWLPQGRPTLIQRLWSASRGSSGITIVFGHERKLARAIRNMHGH